MDAHFNPIRSFVVVCAAFLCVASGAFAQGLGSISGTVVDPAGAVVPGATVVLTQTKTGEVATAVTQSTGLYVFPSTMPADYRLDVKASGFKRYEQLGITLLADQSMSLNVTLQVGSPDVTVDVQADAAVVNTTSGTLSEVIGHQLVDDLPLNGRNGAALTNLVAGVTFAPSAQADQGNTKTFPATFVISANGTLVGQTNYLLDGGNNVDEYTNVNAPFPMPDAVQEFSVQTSNYNAEYGQNAGGVVNIITKSGTNRYHGDLFEFIRIRAFNAANYFSYVNNVKTVDPLKRNQFGGTIGGPLQIPHVFEGKQSFFFFGYQKTINHEIATSATAATLPSTAQLAGTFANEKSCLTDPLQPTAIISCTPNGSTFTTTVNTGAFSPVSVALLKYLPGPSQLNANNAITFPEAQLLRSGRGDGSRGSADRHQGSSHCPVLLRWVFAAGSSESEQSSDLRGWSAEQLLQLHDLGDPHLQRPHAEQLHPELPA